MRTAILLLVLALATGCGGEGGTQSSGEGSAAPSSASPSATTPSPAPSTTDAVASRIIRYSDGTIGGDGIRLTAPGDVNRLKDAPDSFRAFIAELLRYDDAECEYPKSIEVDAIDVRGLAIGGITECGGYIAVWGQDDNGWREVFGTQEPGHPCPADLAGFAPEDLHAVAGYPICEAASQTPEIVNGHVTVRLGETVHFPYFDVTVSEKRSASNGVEGGGIYGVRVTVCYTRRHPGANADGSTRTSPDPWRFGWAHGPEAEWQRGGTMLSGHWQPAYREKQLRVGECNSGWLTADLQETAYVAHIGMRYVPGDFDFGATWNW